MDKILIIDDDVDICTLLERFLKKKGYEVNSFHSGEKAIAFLKSNPVNLIICDFKLPDYNGIEILQKIKILQSEAQVIIITGYSDVRVAVEALRKGAFDYVTKPLYPDEILLTVKTALSKEVEKKESAKNKQSVKKVTKKDFVDGVSEQAKLVKKHISLIAPTDMSVIILGETGTGKEYVARNIHENSQRANEKFVAVDCGALPGELAGSELFGHVKGAFTGAINDKPGCFEVASGGTLFLDEIGNLTYENQVKLLRVLQERTIRRVGAVKDIPIDVRVLVATNENLKKAVKSGDFREDIYHRLNEFQIELAPLRERPSDILMYANHFLKLANAQLDKNVDSFDEQAATLLTTYYWHGNLRELGNVVKRAVLLTQGEQVTKSSLPEEITKPELQDAYQLHEPITEQTPMTLRQVSDLAEKKAILQVLDHTHNNKSKTADLLGIDRKTLYNKLKSYNIEI